MIQTLSNECEEWLTLAHFSLDCSAVSAFLITSSSAIAHSLNLDIIAESLEVEQHATLYRDRECPFSQGSLFDVLCLI